ncbi:peptidase domain-containing ABC transporter [Rhodoferax lacus]|nr:ATP-binding cassette domain-containing protein [Rhodoferax lacus]
MDRTAVLAAIDGHCGADRALATRLQALLTALLDQPDTWSEQARSAGVSGLPARHKQGLLSEVLELPGDLAIVRLSAGGLVLLRHQDQRWQALNALGEPSQDLSDADRALSVQALLLYLPEAPATQRFGSLAALWPQFRRAWAEVGLASFLVNSGQLLLPVFSMLVYDKVVNNGVFETLWALVIGMLIYLVTDTALRLVRAWSMERVSEDLARRSDENLWERLVAQKDVGSGVARFLSNYRDLSSSRDFVSSTYLLMLADLPFLLMYLLVVALVAWPLAIVATLLVLLYSGIGYAVQMRNNRLGREAEKQVTRKLSYMGEMLQALDVVRTVPGAGSFVRHWRELSDQSAEVEGQRRLSNGHIGIVAAGMLSFSTIAMLCAGAYLVNAKLLSVGGLIAANLLTSRAMSLVTSLFTVVGKWKDFERAAARMDASLAPVQPHETTARPSVHGQIAVVGLTKAYKDRPTALDHISLTIRPGERIALLGKPGAGKSTLLRCIAGLSQADSGQILFDGLALDDIAPADRARWLAWKAQDPAIFAGTLESNILVAGSAAHTQRFVQALAVSGLDEELQKGRMSLGMQLSPHGSNLSGGQRQKVALARALAQPCRILLLDEPTLGLDPDGERLLATHINRLLAPEDVLIMTTHSATMLAAVQRVVVLDGGRIIADGPREKIVQTGPGAG